METTEDKHWASKYLLDPLNAPEPSDETGPGTHYRSTFAATSTPKSSSQIAEEKKNASTTVRESTYPSPPSSASPRQERFPHGQEAFNSHNNANLGRGSLDNRASTVDNRSSTEIPTSSAASISAASTSATPIISGRARGVSLTSRFPGDQSHRPLDVIKQQTRIADRAPHLRRKHIVGSDSIDRLDVVGGRYHHDGPYDATLLARNTSSIISPVEAVASTNKEALKATPKEKIIDSIQRHRPLDDVAIVPPGITDSTGHTFDYEEGADLMIEEGNYRRWPGVEYSPDDLKGKGEPSFTIEKALKAHKKDHRRVLSDGHSGIEMTSRPKSSDGPSNGESYTEWENGVRRSNTTGRSLSNRLSRRIGSLRKNRVDE